MMRQIANVVFSVLMHVFPPESRANASWAVEMAPNLTWAKGQVLGQITASKKYSTYATGNSNGTEKAEVIAMFAGKTDADGNVFLGTDPAMTGFEANSFPTLQVYYGGQFRSSELVGLDAGAIADFNARTLSTGADQIIIIPS